MQSCLFRHVGITPLLLRWSDPDAVYPGMRSRDEGYRKTARPQAGFRGLLCFMMLLEILLLDTFQKGCVQFVGSERQLLNHYLRRLLCQGSESRDVVRVSW